MGLLNDILACIKATKEEKAFNAELRKEGLKIAVNQCLNNINETIPSKEMAIKFVLQELDFGEKENIFPQDFLLNSGFHQLEYQNALERFKEDKVELLQIQTPFDNFLRKIKNEEEMLSVSMNIIKQVMYKWEIGKYSLARGEAEETDIQPEEEDNIEVKEIEEKPKIIQYDSTRVNELMEEYSDIIGDIITGINNPKEEQRIEEFKEHISLARQEGHSDYAVVLSCFYEHKKTYNTNLSVKVNEMNGVSLNFLKSILKGFSKQGFSEAFCTYMEENKDEIYLLIQE
jgi:hypothetical protein